MNPAEFPAPTSPWNRDALRTHKLEQVGAQTRALYRTHAEVTIDAALAHE